MLCDPQPRGLKRKYHSDEDDDDDDPPARKSYNQQRQEIFEISYEKLCRFRQAPDSSLLRYVLIFNTMRSVEQEMERDGIKISCLSGGPFLPSVNCEMSTLDPPPPSPYAMADGGNPPAGFPPNVYSNSSSSGSADAAESKPVLPSVISSSSVAINDFGAAQTSANCSGGEYDRCLADIYSKQSSGRVTPFVRTPYDRTEPGALWTDDRLTSLNWSSVLNFNSSPATNSCSSPGSMHQPVAGGMYEQNGVASNERTMADDDGYCSAETSLHTLMPPATCGSSSCISNLTVAYSSSSSGSPNTSPSSGNISPASGSSPTSSEDEIFGDIDLTLYDFDLLSPLSPPNVRMAPVSAEELMRSLSNSSDSAPNSCSASDFCSNGEQFNDEHVTTSVKS